MKIVHLNTHSHGGAAVVARRLHRACLASGIDSTFITKYGPRGSDEPGQRALRDGRLQELVRAGAAHPHVYALGKRVERRLQHRNLANRPAGFEVFSPLNRGTRYHDCVERDDPGILHLHWVAGFVDSLRFFQYNAERKFVWTLHDMNAFTGGCHHADGCVLFERDCARCPQLAGTIDDAYASRVLAAKGEALAQLRDEQLIVVAPSQWLLELSQRSRVNRRFRHVYIANPSLAPSLDATRAAAVRQRLPSDRKIVLFVAENLRNPRKGVNLLFDAIRLMPRRAEVMLVGIGRRTDAPSDVPVTFTGRLSDEETLAGFFAAADAVVNPSVMENAPLTLIEGQTYGAPAVGFKVGGVPELIDAETGVVVAERSPRALADALTTVLFDRQWDRAAISRKADRFAPARVLEQYRAVYDEVSAA